MNHQPKNRVTASANNLAFASVRLITVTVMQFLSRTVFIRLLGEQYLGLNGLFTNILSFLALSELGISVTIQYWLYKPLANDDRSRIKALMRFYALCYRVVGLVIFALGCLLMPFLPLLVNFDQPVPVNLYVVFLLFLANTSLTYLLFAYKQTIFTADQRQSVIEKAQTMFSIVGLLMDIVLLFVFRAFIPYLIGKLIISVGKNLWIAYLANKNYPFIKEKSPDKLDKNEIKSFFNGLYHVFMFRVGSQLMDIGSAILISIKLGTEIVGYYSNYTLIFTQMAGIISLFTLSVRASVGNKLALDSRESAYSLYKELNLTGFLIILPLCMGLLFSVNPFMEAWLGGISENYVFSLKIVVLLVASLFCSLCAQVINLFREGCGYFKIGSHLQVIAGVINIICGLLLGKWFGVAGIILAQVLCKWCITICPFVFRVGKAVFNISGLVFLWEFLRQVLIGVASFVMIYFVSKFLPTTGVVGFFAQGFLAVMLSFVVLLLCFCRSKEFILIRNRIIRYTAKK